MRKIRKHTQLSLTNPKGAGRKAIVNVGIRHIARPKMKKLSALHLTIKVRENKASIKNKRILKALHYAIRRARHKGLRVLHYTLEYNHAHLLVEANDNKVLASGMQSFGITLAKAINRIKSLKGSVYKHRYHFRALSTLTEFKNAMNYIFNNGRKHKRAISMIDPFNSFVAEKLISADMNNKISKSWHLSMLRDELREVLDERRVYFIKQL